MEPDQIAPQTAPEPAPQTALETPTTDQAASEPATSRTEVILPENEPLNTPVPGYLLGAFFLILSIAGGVTLVASYVPELVVEAPAAQAAAVATAKEDFFATLDLKAKSAYVYDARADKEMFSKNASAQLPLASITKVALVLSIVDVIPMESTITISRDAVEKGEGGLTWGEEWNARDLIDFTLITSSNTGAESLAEVALPLLAQKYPEGSQSNATIWRMNSLAQQLGMQETYFLNASGLDASPTQAGAQGSARDIAKLFAYALRSNKELFAGTSQKEVSLGPTNYPERYAHNTNNVLAKIPGIVMGKTGTTDLAGGNLAIAYEVEEGHAIIVVVLGSTAEARYTDMMQIVEAVQKTVAEQ